MTAEPASAVIDVYQRHGAAWAALRSRELVEQAWLDCFCALVPAGGAVLDIGCGSGVPVGRALVGRGYALTGVVGASAMLAMFRRNLPGVPARLADMRHLALGRRFAGLLAWDSFFHLSPADQRPMFARFAAHAEPGAALMFTSGNAEGEAVGELEDEALYHGSLDPAEYRMRLDAAGFDVAAHVASDPACDGRTVWLARRRD